jgi:demethylmenaquinone methyltransferase/2-methoxy-6-polyprenyl-1,4-benzoquinol methylase
MAMDMGGGKGGPKSDINVTPLVDVMLVLLIIMMLIAPMLQKGVDVQLPQAGNTVDKPDTQEQTVVAIDSAPETLRIAEQRVNSANVLFQVGDAYALTGTGRAFNAAFAGFWFSHVPLERQREFLAGLNAALTPGARVVLLDNLYVEGSSSAIAEQDGHGNTYQYRRLNDGSMHRVLKNFPTEAQLHALAEEGLGKLPAYRRWQYYWAFEYRVAEL